MTGFSVGCTGYGAQCENRHSTRQSSVSLLCPWRPPAPPLAILAGQEAHTTLPPLCPGRPARWLRKHPPESIPEGGQLLPGLLRSAA